jgi:hypothetical protein
MSHVLDIKDTPGYPKKPPPKYDKNLPIYNDDPCCVVPHILSLVRYASTFEGRHEDILTRSILCSLGQKQRDWVKCSCSPNFNKESPFFQYLFRRISQASGSEISEF